MRTCNLFTMIRLNLKNIKHLKPTPILKKEQNKKKILISIRNLKEGGEEKLNRNKKDTDKKKKILLLGRVLKKKKEREELELDTLPQKKKSPDLSAPCVNITKDKKKNLLELLRRAAARKKFM